MEIIEMLYLELLDAIENLKNFTDTIKANNFGFFFVLGLLLGYAYYMFFICGAK